MQERWLYSDLWRMASAVAVRLQAQLQSKRAAYNKIPLVAVMVDEGIVLPVIELAVMLVAMAVVPIDPEEPLGRLVHILDDAEPIGIVVKHSKDLAWVSEATNCGKVSPDLFVAGDLLHSPMPSAKGITLPRPAPEDVSHVFFTSGSTGRPKGCVCTHSNLLAYCRAKTIAHGIASDSVVFVASAAIFDPSLGDFFSTWYSGGCVALSLRASILTLLASMLQAVAATHVLATPTLWRAVECAPAELPTLQVLALGGEAMPRGLAETWASSSVILANTYGVTECCVYQTFAQVDVSEPAVRRIGMPLPGTSLSYAVESDADPAKRVQDDSGEVGELWIIGSQVGKGYLNRPELSGERFISHQTLGRCFRTGDVARATAKGWDLVGRRDSQVKINGRRVELSEIEEVLLSVASSILKAVCVVLQQRLLVAWCVLQDEPSHHAGDAVEAVLVSRLLRMLCAEALPRGMCPSRFLLKSELPTTGTGKVSRGSLAKLPLPDFPGDGDAPSAGWESEIAEAWASELGTAGRLTRESHFAALGGDSLAALRVCQGLAALLRQKNFDLVDSAGKDVGGTATAGGEFGELLGTLAPAELLKRPVLHEFAAHLRIAYGSLPVEEQEAQTEAAQVDGDVDMCTGIELASGISTGDALVYKAAADNLAWAVRLLLSRRAAVDQGAARHPSPLHVACLHGSSECITVLLGAKASVGTRDMQGRTPLHFASQRCSVEAITSLLRARAAPNIRDDHRQSALHHAARAGAPAAACNALLNAITAAEGQGGKGGNKKSSHKHGLGPSFLEWEDQWGRTALHWAVINGHRGVASMLLDSQANIKAKDRIGETALDMAARRALCANADRPAGMGASTFGDLVTLLGGSAKTKSLKK